MATKPGELQLVDACIDLGDRPGAAHPGSKVMTLASAFALGADCIDDYDVLHCGETAAVRGRAILLRPAPEL